MKKVTVADVERESPPDENVPDGAAADAVGDARPLTGPLGTSDLSINHYELAPGESFFVAVHRHQAQEEVFYVASGTVTFETVDGDVAVQAGEVLRVPPKTFQLGTNRGDQPATAIALGAPRDYQGKTDVLVACEDCGEETVHDIQAADGGQEFLFVCTDCETVAHRASR